MIVVTSVVRRNSGENNAPRLGRRSVPAALLAAHLGDSGRNGRITIKGIAGMMPLISVWTTLMALTGGMIAADLSLGISPTFFVNALPKAVEIANLTLALGKSVVFGLLIALIACHFGLRVEPNTESLGKGTTASVVTSITVVILVDALFAVVFKDIGI